MLQSCMQYFCAGDGGRAGDFGRRTFGDYPLDLLPYEHDTGVRSIERDMRAGYCGRQVQDHVHFFRGGGQDTQG